MEVRRLVFLSSQAPSFELATVSTQYGEVEIFNLGSSMFTVVKVVSAFAILLDLSMVELFLK